MGTIERTPFGAGGIAGFAEALRRRRLTAERATEACFKRIAALDPVVGAFEHVDAAGALAAARAVDRLLDAGFDPGPLAGVPVALKDVFAVHGTPVHAGSNVPVEDLIGSEGSFVARLRLAGCVIVGKTKTNEFALGTWAGLNVRRGTPWNPWDARVHRAPGGSSSGSAVAVAAGMCGFAIGTDTAGSVRAPAAFSGVFGLKPTVGFWPIDGMFVHSPTLDSIGLLTASAADAALVFAVLTGTPVPAPAPARGLRLGRPTNHFFDGIAPEVAACTDKAIGMLRAAGADVVPVLVPGAEEAARNYRQFTLAELIARVGRDRLLAARDVIDPMHRDLMEREPPMSAETFAWLAARRHALSRSAEESLCGLDAWITPTIGVLAPPVSTLTGADGAAAVETAVTANCQQRIVVNVLGLCATTTPVQHLGANLPVGLQIVCGPGADARALGIARLIEDLVGPPPTPDLAPFLAAA
ncbi:MAG: amidase [Rhodospirillales bacterium]|jgi:aspartyl-tRNA(Asn)/glutamyl-tRNA(Gln) amidotransferase subunit A|nr:amidase [Rhodospirillales bacterium]MDP6805031.1 amidase [Rhodospirillales bacterium]